MQLTLNLVRDLQFVAEDDQGHAIVIQSSKEGVPAGFTPMQLLLLSQAGCMAMDVVAILRKKRLPLRGFRVTAEGQRADQHPKRYLEMGFRFTAVGDVPIEALDEAVRLSEEKYCSVSATLKNAPRMVIEKEVVKE